MVCVKTVAFLHDDRNNRSIAAKTVACDIGWGMWFLAVSETVKSEWWVIVFTSGIKSKRRDIHA